MIIIVIILLTLCKYELGKTYSLNTNTHNRQIKNNTKIF